MKQFMAAVGEYSAEQLIFIDESVKDKRSLSCEYELKRKLSLLEENITVSCQPYHLRE